MNREILERGKNETFGSPKVEYSYFSFYVIRGVTGLDSAVIPKIERRLKMSEELLGKIILIIFVVGLLVTDWKDIWSRGDD
ncbi:hypothetical protein ES705_32291 [subsurface metagenome]